MRCFCRYGGGARWVRLREAQRAGGPVAGRDHRAGVRSVEDQKLTETTLAGPEPLVAVRVWGTFGAM